MKKVFVVTMVLALTLALTSAALAQGPVPAPGGPFNSFFSVQNLETTVANCSFALYNAAGNPDYTSSLTTVNPGAALEIYVPTLPNVPSGSYSAVVSCDKKVAAVSNFSDANSGATYSGVAEPGMNWFAPGIYDDFFNYYSNIVVQNASSGLVDVTVEIFEPGNTVPVKIQTANDVPANAAVSFSQEGLAELAPDEFYSAKISGTGNIAPVVNIYGRLNFDNQLYSYNAFTTGSLTAYAPVVMSNFFGYNTAIVIQNIHPTDTANVKVTYTNGHFDNYTITPGAAESIYTPGVAGVTSGNTLYGATITSDKEIVVLVNESTPTTNRAASYSGFAVGSTEVRAPIVEKRYFDYNSDVTCMNVGNASTKISIVYSNGNLGPTTSPDIAPNQIFDFYQPNDPALAAVAPNYISSATITASQPIVCIVNQDMNEPPKSLDVMDQLYAYNGIAP